MPKVMLINPHPPGRRGEEDISVIVQMPLNLAYLKALTPEHWEVDVIDETIEYALDENGEPTFDADFVGITSVTYQIPRAYSIAAACRKRGMKVAIGGVHATCRPHEVMQYADTVCTGEAEFVWPKMLKDFEAGKLEKLYDGGRLDLAALKEVTPDREFLKKKYNYKFSSIITTRGCPFRCDFCSVPIFQGRAYRERPVADVWAEMEATDYRGLMLAEDNFYGYTRRAQQRCRELFGGMVERGIWKDWFGFTTLNIAEDPIVLDSMAKSGCFGFLCGIESNDPEALKSIKKDANLRLGVSSFKDSIKRVHDFGMIVWGSIIFGIDGDGPDCFKRMVDFVLENDIDVLTFGIYCPMPETELFRRVSSQGRLFRSNLPEDWYYYDSGHLTFQLNSMTLEQFIEGMHYVYDSLYGGDSLRKRFRNSIRATSNPRTSMFALRVGMDWSVVFQHVLDNLHALYDSGDYSRTAPPRLVA